MNNKNNTIRNIFTFFCFSILVFFLFSICLRFCTRILIKSNHCPAALAKIIFFDNSNLQTKEENSSNAAYIEKVSFQSLYPFQTYKINKDTDTKKIINKLTSAKSKITSWSTSNLIMHDQLINLYNTIELNSRFPYSNTKKIFLSNGQITEFQNKCENELLSEKIDNLNQLNDFLNNLDIPLYFYMAPYKIHSSDVREGKTSFSNYNTDTFFKLLENAPFHKKDLREVLDYPENEFYNLYPKTDHHWKISTALYVSKVIAEDLNSNGIELNPNQLNLQNFHVKNFQNSYLGSHGRAVTLSKTDMEDIEIYIPNESPIFNTKIYNSNSLIYSTTGPFQDYLYLDKLQNETTAYTTDAYDIFFSGNHSINIINTNSSDNTKLLLLGDSFINPVKAYLSLCCKQIDFLELREFNGSVQSYIQKNGPYNAVVVLLNSGNLSATINYNNHSSLWDFR